MRRPWIYCVTAGLVWVSTGFCLAEPLDTGALLGEMIDMVRLADFPSPAFKTVQFSSHDRRSVLPGGPDWFANSDGFGGEPISNFEAVLDGPNAEGIGRYLICDVEGPGAIVRTWTAAIEGTIRLFLDGAEEPVFDGPAHEFLQQSYRRWAEAAGLDAAPFEGALRQRDACYFPIPFAKRCRIEWVGNPKRIHFYEVQVRCYDADAEVVTFRPEDLKAFAPVLERVAAVLADPLGKWEYRSQREAVPIEVVIKPRETAEALSIEGPSAIERLSLRLSASDVDRALRQTVLIVAFDGFPWGQVQSPLGDFFGAGPGVNPSNSVPFTVEPDGTMTCRYVMPFARSCRILLENRGEEPVTVAGDVLPLDRAWDDARSMHFRARWRVDHDLIARSGEGAQDLPLLVAQGQGVYVGTAVMLLNRTRSPAPTATGGARGTRRCSSTPTFAPPRSAPAPRTTSTTPGRRPTSSSTPTAGSRGTTARPTAALS